VLAEIRGYPRSSNTLGVTVPDRTLEARKVARDYIQQVFNGHRPDLACGFVADEVIWDGGILGDVTGARKLARWPPASSRRCPA